MKVKAVRALPASADTVCGLHQRALVELARPVAVGRKRSPFVLLSHIVLLGAARRGDWV